MQVLGYTETGVIKAIFSDDGAISFVPDDMGNRYRQAIAEWEEDGNTIPAYVAPSPTPEMLTDEVNRRLSLGFDYNFGDERGVHHFGTTPGDMTRWMQEVTPLAQAAMNMGEPDRLIGIKTNTGLVEVKASEWWLVLDAAAAWRQPLYAAYFGLKAMDPIPADYATNPAYWP